MSGKQTSKNRLSVSNLISSKYNIPSYTSKHQQRNQGLTSIKTKKSKLTSSNEISSPIKKLKRNLLTQDFQSPIKTSTCTPQKSDTKQLPTIEIK